ncbi:hypothetical protein [Aquabacterium sp.]|uniref:hypothetical protein n=1 Tax=Aquabacterium sp. TaxID=1872578 RepID=UPI0019BFEFE8|nr:hypothetical protein [Aquabacterium sp.]MBC7699562.1 hypothetical protein [Aquabacterium sp.]
MNRLQAELQRLYRLDDGEGAQLDEAHDQVLAMVLALGRPADWAALSKVWQGVQADLGLPAPAIAVSGVDGYQVWFSLAEPWPLASAMAFLVSLRGRYLPGIAADRISLMTHPPVVPALQTPTGNWSAFVAPDLAPVFAETPWLDIPPSPDGQADLLCRLESIKRADFQRALERLKPASSKGPDTDAGMMPGTRSPKSFLLEVMNNDTVELSLRIEAAKALLPYV